MQIPWFLATTPAPQPAIGVASRVPRQQFAARPTASWWSRLGARLVAMGEQARHHRMGSWTRR